MNPGFRVFIVLLIGGCTALLSLTSAAFIVLYRPVGPLLCASRCGLQTAVLKLLGQGLYSVLVVGFLLAFSVAMLLVCVEMVRDLRRVH